MPRLIYGLQTRRRPHLHHQQDSNGQVKIVRAGYKANSVIPTKPVVLEGGGIGHVGPWHLISYDDFSHAGEVQFYWTRPVYIIDEDSGAIDYASQIFESEDPFEIPTDITKDDFKKAVSNARRRTNRPLAEITAQKRGKRFGVGAPALSDRVNHDDLMDNPKARILIWLLDYVSTLEDLHGANI